MTGVTKTNKTINLLHVKHQKEKGIRGSCHGTEQIVMPLSNMGDIRKRGKGASFPEKKMN